MSSQALTQAPWARVAFPSRLSMLPLAQGAARELARQSGLDAADFPRVELAVEEVISTLLRYAFDEEESGELVLELNMAPPLFRVEVRSLGLPFDLSMLPDFDPDAAENELDDMLDVALEAGGLSAFLLKRMVDRYRLINDGKQGCRFELEWFLPGRHIAELEEAPAEPAPAPRTPPAPVAAIRPLEEDEAIGLARLVYRSYGYSYVYEDIYYPDRILARQREGLLKSWVAVTAAGRLAGHVALMKDRPDAPAVEWAIAVVDPDWRGGGLMKNLLAAAIDDVRGRGEPVMFAHAVTAHPYTLKTARRFGFEPVALLLAYAPASLQYRHIDEGRRVRGSTFLTIRCMRDWPATTLYLPPRHREAITRLAAALGIEARLADAGAPPSADVPTRFSTSISAAVNVARIDLDRIGPDCRPMLARELRRLCRERVDVINLTVDLADPAAPSLIDAAEACGFFMAGFTPMQPRPASLTLQYLNNVEVDIADIHTAGELSEWVRDWVADEQRRIERQLADAPGQAPA